MKKYKFYSNMFIIILLMIILTGCRFCDSGSGSSPVGEIYVGREILFDNSHLLSQYSGSGHSYRWEFGDEVTGYKYGTAVTHAYMRPGVFKVTFNILSGTNVVFSNEQLVEVAGDYIKLGPRPAKADVLNLKFENTIDNPGDSLAASIENGEPIYTDGIEGKSLRLRNKAILRIKDPESRLSNTGNITISFWMKRNNINGIGRILRKISNTDTILYECETHNASPGVIRWNAAGSTREIWGLLNTTRWYHIIVSLNNGRMITYVNGVEVDNSANTGSIPASAGDFLIGDSTEDFDFNIDELRIYKDALTTEEMFYRFEILHADFHARIGQYLHFFIPPDMQGRDNVYLRVFADSTEILYKNNLTGDERCLLKTGDLEQGKHEIRGELIIDGTTSETIIRRFTKQYSGKPPVGIDENNAIWVRNSAGVHELFFPITPFMLNEINIKPWSDNNYINSIYALSGDTQNSSPGDWRRFLDTAAGSGVKAVGPGSQWNGFGGRNSDLQKIADYVSFNKDHTSQLFWIWKDEPDLGTEESYVTAQHVRAWTLKSHENDPYHPVSTNLCGEFINEKNDWGTTKGNEYQFMTNAAQFGQKTFVADVYGMDYYPIEWAAPHNKQATMGYLSDCLKLMKQRSHNLVPYMSFVETCDISELDNSGTSPTPWHPSPQMLKMLIWINVVNGVKGINWFHWHSGTPDNNLPVMVDFKNTMDELKGVILGPDSSRTVTVNAGEAKIDTLVKEHQGAIYLFAVRVSEVQSTDNGSGYPDPVQTGDAAVTFNFNDTSINDADVEVYGETRSTAPILTNGVFSDQFAPFAVHIYIIRK